MPPYDSESSDEGEEYTETNVLLGYASKEETGDSISHLGGRPTWIDENSAPSGALAKCRSCNGLLTLLLELNGDLPDHFPGHERRLYIWTCRQKACRRKEGSVRSIRGVRIAKGKSAKPLVKRQEQPEAREEKKAQHNMGGSLFGTKDNITGAAPNPFSNPFSSTQAGQTSANPFSSTSASSNPFGTFTTASPLVTVTSDEPKDEAETSLPATFADKVRLNTPTPPADTPRPHEPWPADSSFPSAYPHYYLDAEYETLDAPSVTVIPANTRVDIDEDLSAGSGGGKEDKEVFESTIDKTFQKFADRVGENAEQILRYEFKGKPLLYSDSDKVGKQLAQLSDHGASSNTKIKTSGSRSGSGIPRCQLCGADRVFEVQLTPHAITELEADETSIEGMEWGTIILGVCSNDCKPADVAEGEVGYAEEWAGVQWEETASKR